MSDLFASLPPITQNESPILGSVARGAVSFILAQQLKTATIPVVHVCRDEKRLDLIHQQLCLLVPNIRILTFHPWDGLPYDRVSPKKQTMAKRLQVLDFLKNHDPKDAPFCLLTTPQAFVQRLMPPDHLRRLSFKVGKTFCHDTFLEFAKTAGYERVDTVQDAGDFALRGGIVDLFPAQDRAPCRLDLFGDTIESLWTFDPVSQRRTDPLASVDLYPATETLLTPQTVASFRQGYRALAHGDITQDPLYQALSHHTPAPGMEHWLPLFYDPCRALTDYLPTQWFLSFDIQAQEALSATLGRLQDHYLARQGSETKWGLAPYHPIPPQDFFLTAKEVEACLKKTPHQTMVSYDEGTHILESKPFHPWTPLEVKETNHPVERLLKRIKETFQPHIIVSPHLKAQEQLGQTLEKLGWPMPPTFATIDQAIKEAPRLGLTVFPLESGFSTDACTLVSMADLYGSAPVSYTSKKTKRSVFQDPSSMTVGDFVVHTQHGIARYEGLVTLDIHGRPHDFVALSYAANDKLYVPVENLDVLNRYAGEASEANLDRLGSQSWQKRKERVEKRLMDMADHLIQLAAHRKLEKSEPIPLRAESYGAFAASFPYDETQDQHQAIQDVLGDLGAETPMDRLVCGDVGFGKTEVAMRAAFVAMAAGKQVAMVVPTTLLCRQHALAFQKRFEPHGLRVAQLSRLVPPRDAQKIKDELKKGTLPMVVGTHGLFRSDPLFKDLGLVIVDEEQHFGVKQKERLKEQYPHVNLLTLTATPIPRTLHMALSGVRDLSLIATPPVDRLAVHTYVLRFDGLTLREALMREIFRGGQAFLVCPRIEDLDRMADRLAKVIPEARVLKIHGQMNPNDIEKAMLAFCDHDFDVMLCTNIVESGLDLPRVNTIIIHRADHFGLAQLYQLRGRVGRGKHQGYAYLTFEGQKPVTKVAEKRLHVIQSLDTLGAGFQIASHDMDIRGAGNLLGAQQSGHIKEVGAALYQQMFEEALAYVQERQRLEGQGNLHLLKPFELKGQNTPTLHLPMPVLIPDTYMAELSLRLDFYQRLSASDNDHDLVDLRQEMEDRFGPLPQECENLFEVLHLKILCRQAHIERVDVGPRGAVVSFWNNHFPQADKLIQAIQSSRGTMVLKPDHRLGYIQSWSSLKDQKAGLKDLLTRLAHMATQAA